MRSSILRRTTALAGGVAILGFIAAAPAAGADGANGDVEVVNSETVQVYMNADGDIDTKRVYEQLALTGQGNVDLANPIATAGLRNLDGFDDFEVKDGEQLVKTDVDGEKKLRSVSDFTGNLPLAIDVDYQLDGRTVKPGDLVGKSGKLEVTFDVENITGKMQEVEVPDGKGGTDTKTVEVPIPMVGSLSSVAPANFTNVASKQANLAGDGKGGTKLSFTMTLFPPVGSTHATFGYTADVRDGVVPKIEVSALPINPLESPTFASAAKSYQGGADTGEKLTDGAVEIDANLLRLRDGAEELVAGLIKLREGSGELSDGLNNTAVPGAAKLAAGAEELSLGLLKLDDGAGKLADGAGELSDGTRKASDGSTDLKTGANKLSDGLTQAEGKMPALKDGSQQLTDGSKALAAGLKELRAGVAALPTSVQESLAASPEYQALLGALQSIADGVGSRGDAPDAGTLLGGINAVQYGMRHPAGYANTDCAVALTGGTPERCGAMDGVEFVAEQLASGATDLNQLKPVLGILNGVSAPGDAACPGYPNYAPPPTPPTNACQAVSTLYYGLFGAAPAPAGAQAKVTAAASALQGIQQKVRQQLLDDGAGLDRLRAGLNNPAAAANCLVGKQTPSPADDCGIKEAALFLKNAGIPLLVDSLVDEIQGKLLAGIGTSGSVCKPGAAAQLLPCAETLAAGQTDLNAGIKKLVGGVSQLQAGGVQLSAGAGELSSGLGQIDDGAGKLADGAGQLSDGTSKASDGGTQVADGAGQLSDGLGDAADGSTLIFGGLTKAAGSAPALPAGAKRLSDEGTKKLIAAGEATTANYGEMVSVIEAGAERGSAEKMAYGAPEDASGLTAYSYIITGESGESGRNMARALGGLAVFGAAGGMFLLRRRGVI